MGQPRKAASALIGEDAGRARIRDLGGEEHELRELWADRAAVLVFLRHVG